MKSSYILKYSRFISVASHLTKQIQHILQVKLFLFVHTYIVNFIWMRYTYLYLNKVQSFCGIKLFKWEAVVLILLIHSGRWIVWIRNVIASFHIFRKFVPFVQMLSNYSNLQCSVSLFALYDECLSVILACTWPVYEQSTM